MMARLSSHHSTCRPSGQQDGFSSCQAQLQGAHCVRSCQAAAGGRPNECTAVHCSSANCLSWLLNQAGLPWFAKAVKLAVMLAVLLLLTRPKLTFDSSSRRVAS